MLKDSSNFSPEDRHLRSQPPRFLPKISRLALLLSGSMQQIGWGLFAFSMLFFWVFVMNSPIANLFRYEGSWKESQGELVQIGSTGSTVNDQHVYAYDFEFRPGAGAPVIARAYGFRNDWTIGEQIPLRYRSYNPKTIELEGVNSSLFPAFVGFVLIFPSLALLFIFYGLYSNRKNLYIIQHGLFCRARLLEKTATSTRINERMVYKYHFQFQLDQNTFSAYCRTHQSEKVEDEEEEIVLYLAEDPQKNIVFDAVSGPIDINPRGELQVSPWAQYLFLILPFLSIALNSLYYYLFGILKFVR